MKKGSNNINFYTAYRDSLKEKKSPSRWLGAVLPLILIVAAVAAVTVYIRFQNVKKQAELDGINRQVLQLDSDYQEVQDLGENSTSAQTLADGLQADADLASALPRLDENLFTQVNACAAGTFTISDYRYDEETRMLEIDAAAPSVNDVPQLVEALRNTALFSSVRYIGYTSDTDGVYYCTVGCVLAGQEEEGQ